MTEQASAPEPTATPATVAPVIGNSHPTSGGAADDTSTATPAAATPATPESAAPHPGPVPSPAAVAGQGVHVAPTPTPAAPAPAAPALAAPAPAAPAGAASPSTHGRVDPDGTVYVITRAGERAVGQIPDTTPEEALEFYTRRYESLAVGVELLATRIQSGAVAPDEAAHQIKKERKAILEASAVGDLDGLLDRLDGLAPQLEEHRQARRAEKAEQQAQARATKEEYVAKAEQLAAGTDWRHGVNRFRDLLEQWKALPRIDKATDDELWHRFSSARSTYTRRRKAQFAEQASKRDDAAAKKRAIVAEAQKLATSTDWGPTSGEFRDLMQRWKAAGPAPREVDDKLWQEFRAIQDQFFAARTAAQSEQDQEFVANQQAKEALLAEYEPKIKPAQDLAAARTTFRELLDRWSEIGKVPRDAMRTLDGRIRALESSLKKVEDDQWKRTNPEARARAEDTASKLREQIATYEEKAAKAEKRGDVKAAAEARKAADTYRSWLSSAEAAASDFSG